MRIVVLILFASLFNSLSIYGESRHIHHLPNKCATFSTDKKKNFHQSLILNDDFRPKLNKSFSSNQGNFLVHYDVEGKHSVPEADLDQNGIPDYVDSVAYYFEYVYQKEVIEMGYLSPIPDSGSGGSYQYDVYLIELGDSVGWYGYTEQEIQTNESEAFPTFLSFIVIDNDFSEKDSILNHNDELVPAYNTYGIDALKITAAHEFFHAVQFMYGLPIGIGLAAEMTSTFMETHLFPDIDDYLQYLRNYLNYPFLFSFASGGGITGYQFVGFAIFLESKYGASFFKRFWEVLSAGNRTFQTIEKLEDEFDFDFNADWLEFAEWVYHTGTRAVPGKYFKNAEDLPEIYFERDVNYSNPSFMHSSSVGAYMFEAYRIKFGENTKSSNGTLDILVTETDFAKGRVQSDAQEDFYLQCTDDYQQGAEQLKLGCYYKFTHSSEHLVDILYQYNEITPIPFPQPYRHKIDRAIHFPVPSNTILNVEADIILFNVAMEPVLNDRYEVRIINGKQVLTIDDLPEIIGPGVYIFQTIYNDESVIGKFTVK